MGKFWYVLLFLCFSSYSICLSGQAPVEYFFLEQLVCKNDTVEVPLLVGDFINVQNFQSSVRWNPADLTFQSLTAIHPGLTSNFLINTDSTDSGGLGYFWLDNSSGEPLVLADSSVLFVLKFTGSSGVEPTEIGFGEVPTLTETVVENNGVPMQVTSVQIPAMITSTELTADVAIQAATGGNNGQINLTLITGQPPFSFLWNNNETTEDIENLTAGDYTVVVTDAQGCSASFNYVVDMSTATKNDFSNTVLLSPNPTHDYLSINFINTNLNDLYEYKLYDLRANIILQKNKVSPEITEKINLQNQPVGVYFLEIKTENLTKVFKIFKK